MMMEDIIKQMQPHIDFAGFFTLPDGEKEAGFFWHDKAGNPIELDITQRRNSKLIQWHNNVKAMPADTPAMVKTIKRQIEGSHMVPFKMIQTKTAATNEDFELIYQRELTKANAKDGEAFRQWIVRKVTEMAEGEKSLKADDSKRSISTQDVAGKFLVWLAERGKEKQKNALQKDTQRTYYESFDDLFKEEYATKIEAFIAILRETEKPCINEGYDYNATYRQKAVFFVWFDALVYKQIIHRDVTDRNEIARLLNQKFTGLDVSGSLYSNDSMTNARAVHKDYFEAQITAIKAQIK